MCAPPNIMPQFLLLLNPIPYLPMPPQPRKRRTQSRRWRWLHEYYCSLPVYSVSWSVVCFNCWVWRLWCRMVKDPDPVPHPFIYPLAQVLDRSQQGSQVPGRVHWLFSVVFRTNPIIVPSARIHCFLDAPPSHLPWSSIIQLASLQYSK